jgi:hypothetical protein
MNERNARDRGLWVLVDQVRNIQPDNRMSTLRPLGVEDSI